MSGAEIIFPVLIAIAKRLLGRPLNASEKEVTKAVAKAIDHAQSEFHKHYDDLYGVRGSTFIDRENNQESLLLSTFPRGKRLAAVDLHPEGFDGSPKAPEEAVTFFLDAFYLAIDQTTLRALDGDLSQQEAKLERHEILERVSGIEGLLQQLTDVQVGRDDPRLNAALNESEFPNPIRAAITEPSLNELSEIMKKGHVKQALDYAQRHINAIDAALNEDSDPDNRYAEELRSYRQRLLFAAASAASWQGDIEAGREYWRRANDLGRIDPEWHQQAAITLFNVGLNDEFCRFARQMDQEDGAYRKIVEPCLAYVEKEWSKVDELLADARSADQLLQRVEARLQIIDSKDIEAVRLTAKILDQSDSDTTLPGINLTRVQLTVDLLKWIIREYTPLDFDRHPLITSLFDRLDTALETTEPDSLFRAQAIGCLRIAAELLRDDQLNERFKHEVGMLDEEIRSSVFPLYDSSSTPDRIRLLQTEGHFDATTAAIMKAGLYQASLLPEDVESELYEALFSSVNKRQRKDVLLLLVQHLRRKNRVAEAQKLIDATPLRPADKWLVRANNLPAGKTPLDLVDEVKNFPLDVDVIEHLAQYTLSTVRVTSPENATPDQADLNRAEEAVHWTTRLIKVLPSKSSLVCHAQALFAARRYKELLKISRDLDIIYAEQAAEFEAWALVGLGRRTDAIDRFISAFEKYPESVYLSIHAAHFLLIENRPEEAAKLLKLHITADSQDPDILCLYARSIHNQAPSSQDHASRAFDLFAKAYDLQPDPNIAQWAWQSARAAGREAESRRFFDAMVAEMPVKVVETEEDFSQAMQAAGENRGVLIEGGLEYLAKMFKEDRNRSGFLGELLHAHALSYTDFFQHSGRSWELWTYWTQQFEKRTCSGESSPGEFSVLADWPFERPRYDLLHDVEDTKLFLDQTAILTFGVLGPDTTERILTALGTCYIHPGSLEEFHHDLGRITGQLRMGEVSSYAAAAEFLSQRPGAVVNYSEEIESAAPNDPDLGPCRVDLGVAILNDGLYVTDLDNSDDWPKEANRLRISSATLLALLNNAGKVTADQARNAANKRPNAFEGWDSATLQPIPETLVLNEYALLDWTGAGLAIALEDRIKVGPWAWRCISEESERHKAMELAHERITNTINVLQVALEEGILVEAEAKDDTGTQENADEQPDEEVMRIEVLWSGALKSLRTAQSNGLQLWADDRFYPLLVRFGGPRNLGAGVNAIREPFIDWAEETPPFSTMELLYQLSSAGRLSSTVAQHAVAKLFSQGYRVVHPLLLTHTLHQYPVPTSGQPTLPFLKLVNAITEIPKYFSETFNGLYGIRDGSIRVASVGLAERLIIGVWEAEDLSIDQRCTLANAFVDAVEQVFEGLHPKGTSFRADRTPISFWQGIAYSLQMMRVANKCPFERYFAALQWIGKAAASRVDQRGEVLRVLEDNFLDSLKYALRAFGGSDEENSLRQIIATFIAPAFIPLTNASFNSILDPLLRRTASMLARFTGGGRITKNYYHNSDRNGTPLKVSEEEDEKAAAEVLVRVISGDSKYARFIWGIDLVFSYTHPVPEEWTDEGFPAGQGIGVDVRCSLFTLLWHGPRVLRENIIRLLVYRLAVIDPVLAYRIILVEDDLLSDDAEKVQEAHDRLGVELLRSGYFDLQRDLVHAVQRFSCTMQMPFLSS